MTFVKGQTAWNKGVKRWWKSPTEFKKGVTPWNLGKKWDEATKEKMASAKLGKRDGDTNRWLGDKVKYRALHSWVAKKLGKAIKCEHCGKEKTTPKSIHWANKSHSYLRDLSDWLQLCVTCHKKYDKKF